MRHSEAADIQHDERHRFAVFPFFPHCQESSAREASWCLHAGGAIFVVIVTCAPNRPAGEGWIGTELTTHQSSIRSQGIAQGYQTLEDDTRSCTKCKHQYGRGGGGVLGKYPPSDRWPAAERASPTAISSGGLLGVLRRRDNPPARDSALEHQG